MAKFTRFSLQIHSLLVICCKITRSSLLVVTTLVACYSLQKLLVPKYNLSLIMKLTSWKFFWSKVNKARWRNFPKAEKLKIVSSLLTCYIETWCWQNASWHNNMEVVKISPAACSKSKRYVTSYQISYLFFKLCQLSNTKLIFFKVSLSTVNTCLKSACQSLPCLNRRLFIKTICLWQRAQQLIVLSHKNKQNCIKHFIVALATFQVVACS